MSTLRHIVLCAFRDDTSAAQRALIVREFLLLKEKIPTVLAIEWGLNNSPEGLSEGLTHCFTLRFAAAAQRDAYLIDPAHQRFVDLIKPSLSKVVVVDYLPSLTT